VITGSNSGIGLATAQELSKMGANIVLAVRNKQKGDEAKELIVKGSGKDLAQVMEVDLASLESINRFVNELKKKNIKIDVLINNAGVLGGPPEKTVDGFPFTFGVNHLGPFLLTILLLNNNLFNEKNKDCRIVNVSSKLHERGSIGFESNFDSPKGAAYAQSKLANILFTEELSKKLKQKNSNIVTCSLHPGLVSTNLFENPFKSYFGNIAYYAVFAFLNLFGRTPVEGAQTVLYCTLNPNIQPGKYYDNCAEVQPKLSANHEEDARKLWVKSEELVKVKLK